MALFKDAVEITDNSNNKQVKCIKDSNGNIIWGSQSSFPYRKLEYINFSGTEYIDTLEKPQVGFYYLDAVVPNTNQSWSFIWGAGHTVSGTFYRLFWQTEGNIAKSRLKADNQNSKVATSNNLRQFRVRIYSTNNSSGTFWRAIQDMNGVDVTGLPDSHSSTGTELWGLYTNNSSYGVNLNNFNTTLAIGAYHNNGSWSSAGAWLIGKVYRYYVRVGAGDTALRHAMFPVQRKSDNVCGLYDVITNTFYPMQGTNITNSAAGPTLNEYWDLTA